MIREEGKREESSYRGIAQGSFVVMEQFCYLGHSDSYMNLHVIKLHTLVTIHTRIQISACTTGEI